MKNNQIEYFDIVEKALHRAGDAILSYYDENVDVEIKSDGSPVTLADKAAHHILIDDISKTGIPVYTEESQTMYPPADTYWCVDPLDGTKDFIHKTGDFSILVALIDKGIPVIGFVYQPTNKDLYFAQKGKGAYVKRDNDVNILQVDSDRSFSQQKMLVSRFHLREDEKNLREALDLGQFRQKGSIGLKISDIAFANAHIYINFSDKTNEWDAAAPQVILQEAGGVMTDVYGNPLKYAKKETNNPHGVVASSGYDHQLLIQTIGRLLSST